ncbi:MAG: putative endonuclease [Bacteroidia bacterium]|jgi:putative endonuclease
MFVYILECKDQSFYTGVTNNIQRRLEEHESGLNPSCYTFSRRPLTLVYQQMFNAPEKAIQFEKQLKKWSRKKKLALIKGHYEELPLLSKKHFDQ